MLVLAFLLVAIAAPTVSAIVGAGDGCTELSCGDDCAPNCTSCTCAHRVLQVVMSRATSISPAPCTVVVADGSAADVPTGFVSLPYRPPRA